MKRIVVTGASGFIGRHVLSPLLARGYEVVAVCRRMPSGTWPSDLAWRECDLCDSAQVKTMLDEVRPFGLVHLAWITTPGDYWTSAANLTWLAASLELMRRFAEGGGKRIVVAGTSAEYKWGGERPLDESASPLQPQKLYGKCKNALREILEEWAPETGVSWAWGRIFNVFGPHEHAGRLAPKIINHLLAGREAPFDSGASLRDFLHVADAGEAFAALFDSPVAGPVNIANGEATSVREFLSAIAKAVSKPDHVLFDSLPQRPDEYPRILASASRIRREVGWLPAAPLDERVRETCRWWQDVHARTGERV